MEKNLPVRVRLQVLNGGEIGIHMFMWFRRDLDMELDLAG